MSWDISLIDDRGHTEGDWSYTHNCNSMIEHVLGDALAGTPEPFWSSSESGLGRRSWWTLLNGKSGRDGQNLLAAIIIRLEAEPERFRAMNPPNGWGDYDSLLEVLRAMRDAVPDYPSQWKAWG